MITTATQFEAVVPDSDPVSLRMQMTGGEIVTQHLDGDAGGPRLRRSGPIGRVSCAGSDRASPAR